jgi:uncharacterized LabA/DUF88 family protein
MYDDNRVAVLIDGGFFLRRLPHQFPQIDPKDPKAVARLIHSYAVSHCRQRVHNDADGTHNYAVFQLYRIFFYDCPPFEKKMQWPVSKKAVDFAKSEQAKFRRSLHDELKNKRKTALRMGHMLDFQSWRLKREALPALMKGELKFEELTDDHFALDISQKGVDMRLGLDVAALAYKKLVDQIVLVIGDSDFVPAAKMARREGIDIILDPMGLTLHRDLLEHTDGVRTPERQNKPAKANKTAA